MSAFAPGRVNLIGEHTDYNGGLALPFAIGQGITVAADPTAEPGSVPLVAAVAAELGLSGVPPVRIESDLPAGEGLSSSAALCVATALELGAHPEDALGVARLCQRAERAATGVATGLLDQLASLLGRAGQGVLIDFSEPAWRYVPFDLAGARLVVIPSGAPRTLAEAGYAARRAECAAGHPARMRHVTTENERVRQTVAALEAGEIDDLGPLLDASHASLRDDFEVSVPAVERTVADAKASGALGARIMGGGFGGSVLALFPPGVMPPPGATVVEPSPGARRIRE